MTKQNPWKGVAAASAVALAMATQADAFSSRSGDNQNTSNVGEGSGLTAENVADLDLLEVFATPGTVNATPVFAEGLMITGDWQANIVVVDVSVTPSVELLRIETGASANADGREDIIGDGADSGGAPAEVGDTTGKTGAGHISEELGNYVGMQSTPNLAQVTTPNGEELRVFAEVQSNTNTLWCVNLTKVLADREALAASPALFNLEDPDSSGAPYLCEGTDADGFAAFPRSLSSSGTGAGQSKINSSAKFVADQAIVDPETGETVTADVLYTPTTGMDCTDGRMWAMDAYTGKLYWDFDPVPGDLGGAIWTTPALSADGKTVFITTGDCVTKPQSGAMAEAVVALDAATGAVLWAHQKRLFDAADLDIGCGPTVVDVPGRTGCNVLISADKDGCIYAYNQAADIPEIGDLGYDPLRPGQQRLLWQKCMTSGSLNGGFNASNGGVDGRTYVHTANGYPVSHIGADDSNAFALDACTGQLQWASSDISNGRTDLVIADGMSFHLGSTRKLAGGPDTPYQWIQEVTVVGVDSGLSRVPDVLASVKLPAQGSLGGGGPAISGGKLFVPVTSGVAIFAVSEGSNASAPIRRGANVFAGPYPYPVAPGPGNPASFNPDDPYPLMMRKPSAPDTFKSLSEGGPQGVLPELP